MNSPFLRQAFVAGSPLLAAISVGGTITYPVVLLHQLKSNTTSIELDFDTSTWIGSIHGIGGMLSVLIPALMQWKGRKLIFILSCLTIIAGWLTIALTNTVFGLLIGESLHGLGSNSILTVSYLSISEMVSPNYRETYMQLYEMFQVLGMTSNSVMTYYVHWRTIAIIMASVMVLSTSMACLWPESPYWLALTGQFDRCREEFTWIRGRDEIAMKELEELIASQVSKRVLKRRSEKVSIRNTWHQIRQREFYIPALHMFLLLCLVYGNGVVMIVIYAMEILAKLTTDENAVFYGVLIINMILAGCIFLGIVISRFFFKKPTILLCSILVAVFLGCTSIVTYLQSIKVLDSMVWSLLFMAGYMASMTTGISCVAFPTAPQLIPVKYRGIGGILFGLSTCILHTTVLKVGPYLIRYLKVWGTFSVYATNSLIFGFLVWIYIPETKDLSLQEIENYYTYRTVEEEHVEDNEGMLELYDFNVLNKDIS